MSGMPIGEPISELGAPAENLLRCGIGEQHDAVLVNDDDSIGILLDEESDFRLVDAAAGMRLHAVHRAASHMTSRIAPFSA